MFYLINPFYDKVLLYFNIINIKIISNINLYLKTSNLYLQYIISFFVIHSSFFPSINYHFILFIIIINIFFYFIIYTYYNYFFFNLHLFLFNLTFYNFSIYIIGCMRKYPFLKFNIKIKNYYIFDKLFQRFNI